MSNKQINFDPEKHSMFPEEEGGGFVDKTAYDKERAGEEADKMKDVVEELGVHTTRETLYGDGRVERSPASNTKKVFNAAEQIVEQEAHIVAVARLETDYRYKKYAEARWNILREKSDGYQKNYSLKITQGERGTSMWTEDTTKWDYLEYQGKRINDVNLWLKNRTDLEAFAQMDENDPDLEKQFLGKSQVKWAKQFKAEFDALPPEVQQAAQDWVAWYWDTHGTGWTLDALHAANVVKDPQYNALMEARAQDKLILSGEMESTASYSATGDAEEWATGKRKGRFVKKPATVYYWAIAEKPEDLI